MESRTTPLGYLASYPDDRLAAATAAVCLVTAVIAWRRKRYSARDSLLVAVVGSLVNLAILHYDASRSVDLSPWAVISGTGLIFFAVFVLEDLVDTWRQDLIAPWTRRIVQGNLIISKFQAYLALALLQAAFLFAGQAGTSATKPLFGNYSSWAAYAEETSAR